VFSKEQLFEKIWGFDVNISYVNNNTALKFQRLHGRLMKMLIFSRQSDRFVALSFADFQDAVII
jgi:hypothetical protein